MEAILTTTVELVATPISELSGLVHNLSPRILCQLPHMTRQLPHEHPTGGITATVQCDIEQCDIEQCDIEQCEQAVRVHRARVVNSPVSALLAIELCH